MKKIIIKDSLKDYLKEIKQNKFLFFFVSLFFAPLVYSSETLKSAALNGDLQSQIRLGFYYSKGADKNLLESAYWMKMAAKSGSPLACRYLGHAHIHGNGVTKSLALAKKWFHLSVCNGDNQSLINLAKCNEMEENWLHALAWYQVAYDTGDSSVEDSINRVRNFLSDTEKELITNLILDFKQSILPIDKPISIHLKSETIKVTHLELKNGNSYWGEAKDQTPHGYGKRKLGNKTIYQGEFKNGLENGYGTSFDRNGKITFQGVWKNGKPSISQ